MKQLLAILVGVVLCVSAALLTSNAQPGVVKDDKTAECIAECRRSIDPNRDQFARAAYEECVKQCERQKWKDVEEDASSNK